MWQAIRQNKIKSAFFIVAMGMLLFAMGGVFGGVLAEGGGGGVVAGLSIAGAVWFFMTVIALSQGKNILLALSGAREVRHDDAPQLYNIVEEMRIAAALPSTPKVYIMESRAPNAFAVGSPGNCAVAVTSGLLSILTRDELQGVVAHEIGHIKNQDTRFMTITGVMLGTIIILADMFSRTLFYGGMGGRRSRSSRDSGGAQAILMVVGILMVLLAPFLAQILYFACSRSREYLADASAAIFTRFPEGLASALEKIGAKASIPLESANRVTAPMYIIPPMGLGGKAFSSVFSTHPPTRERVEILRSMAGGAGLANYNDAYRKIKGEDVVGKSAAVSDETLRLRGLGEMQGSDPGIRRRTRDANDLVMKMSNFKFVACPCGLKIKIPPTFPGKGMACPRCGKEHPL